MLTIIFEGLPGSGKTSLSRELSKKYKLPRIGEILDSSFNELRPWEVKNQSLDYYMASDERKIFVAQKNNCLQFMDRSHFSTVLYTFCNKNKKDLKKVLIWEKQISLSTLNPLFIYLKITPELSLLRKNKIPCSSYDLWSYPKNLKETNFLYSKILINNSKINSLVIDASMSYENVRKIFENILVNKFL